MLQESCYHPRRVLCITFGAPPTYMAALQKPQLVVTEPDYSSLFWNFLFADMPMEAAPNITLRDVMPALFSSVPSSCKTKQQWLDAAEGIYEDVASTSAHLQECIKRVARAGAPAYRLWSPELLQQQQQAQTTPG